VPYPVYCLKRAFNFEGKQSSTLNNLCPFILANKDELYPFYSHFLSKLIQVTQRYLMPYQTTPQQRQISVDLIQVLFDWLDRLNQEGRLNSEGAHDYNHIFQNIFFMLIRTTIMIYTQRANDNQRETQVLAPFILKMMRQIFFLWN